MSSSRPPSGIPEQVGIRLTCGVNLILIGYWRSETDAAWPDPRAFIDDAWDNRERRSVYLYLGSGIFERAYRGLSPCRLCRKQNGHREFTDGTYLWPEGLAHYVLEHAVRLPNVFVQHALNRLNGADPSGGISLDTDWWREQGAG